MKLHQTVLERQLTERFLDRDGKPVREGAHVRLKVPPDLLEGLPARDQAAIVAAAKGPLLVSELMTDFEIDDIELRFVDKNGTIHFIYVAGKHLRVLA